MKTSVKVLIVILLAGIVAGFAVIQIKNKELVEGKIIGDENAEESLPPDLKPSIESLGADENGSLRVRVSMENIGKGPVFGDTLYSYALYINDQLVLTNTDSYVQMNPGDKFSFIYPIDKEVYTYENTGSVKIVVDEEDKVEESDEENNMAAATYEL
ncbi:MAG: CARDB domain-containing protein [Candidatus Gracilibacteria bacterium]